MALRPGQVGGALAEHPARGTGQMDSSLALAFQDSNLSPSSLRVCNYSDNCFGLRCGGTGAEPQLVWLTFSFSKNHVNERIIGAAVMKRLAATDTSST